MFINSTNGTIFKSYGKQTFSSDGRSFNRIDDTIFSDTGEFYRTHGRTTICSDGRTFQCIGNVIIGSDGSVHQIMSD